MKKQKERCDHCGEWVMECQLVIPHLEEKYCDGSVGVCQKCIKKYPKNHWQPWFNKKYLQEEGAVNMKKGMITIVMSEDYVITLNSKTMDDFNALQKWHCSKEETTIIAEGLTYHSIARRHVIKISFGIYTE